MYFMYLASLETQQLQQIGKSMSDKFKSEKSGYCYSVTEKLLLKLCLILLTHEKD